MIHSQIIFHHYYWTRALSFQWTEYEHTCTDMNVSKHHTVQQYLWMFYTSLYSHCGDDTNMNHICKCKDIKWIELNMNSSKLNTWRWWEILSKLNLQVWHKLILCSWENKFEVLNVFRIWGADGCVLCIVWGWVRVIGGGSVNFQEISVKFAKILYCRKIRYS